MSNTKNQPSQPLLAGISFTNPEEDGENRPVTGFDSTGTVEPDVPVVGSVIHTDENIPPANGTPCAALKKGEWCFHFQDGLQLGNNQIILVQSKTRPPQVGTRSVNIVAAGVSEEEVARSVGTILTKRVKILLPQSTVPVPRKFLAAGFSVGNPPNVIGCVITDDDVFWGKPVVQGTIWSLEFNVTKVGSTINFLRVMQRAKPTRFDEVDLKFL